MQRRAMPLLGLLLGVPLLACGLQPWVQPELQPTPTTTPMVLAASATPAPVAASATPTPVATAVAPPPTWTPIPLPRIAATPSAVTGAEFLYRTGVLDVYADRDIDQDLRAWLVAHQGDFDEMTASIERRLRTPLEQRIVLLVQPPEDGGSLRTNCPARGAATRTEEGTLFIWLFADEETPLAQREAVIAHEIAHQVIRTKLGDGGDVILNEGLANWSIPAYWRDWQKHPSFDAFVIDSIAAGTYIPLMRSTARNFATPTAQEDCFETRDQVYNQWASFSDFLIRHYGWRAVQFFWQQPAQDWEDFDYEVGFGKSLEVLEQEWLSELGRGRGAM